MKHPTREEWAPFVCGETNRAVRRQLEAHLRQCPECRGEVQNWQQSLRRLDHWKLPQPRGWLELFAPILKWSFATALVLVIGFVAGRMSTPGVNTADLRARLAPQLRETLRQEMAQMVRDEVNRSASATLAAAGDHAEKLLAAYTTIQETRRSEELERLYVTIKKQLDTVAINTQKEFVQLAGYTRDSQNPADVQHQ